MADQSSVGNHLAELYNNIHVAQQRVEDAKAKVKEEETALDKVKSDFADYLKQAGVYQLIAPTQGELFNGVVSEKATSGEKKERKPRTSSEDRQAGVERNRAIYTSEYPLGLDGKTGLPKRYKGRGSANDAINAQMADDERDFEAKQGSGDAGVADATKALGDAVSSVDTATDELNDKAAGSTKLKAKKK